jgi:ribonuclease PH
MGIRILTFSKAFTPRPLIYGVFLMQMDAKLPIDTFENVMQLAVEGCKAIANYIREVSDSLNMIE